MCKVKSLGFQVQDFGMLGVRVSGVRVQGLEFKVKGLVFRV